MEICNYRGGDEIAILDLFSLVYKKQMKPAYWNWRFQDNPAGKHLIKLMWDNDKLVGHYAVSPVKMRIGTEVYPSVMSMTTMTHPDYGGRGIFSELANSLYADLEQNNGVKAIWGFPNNNSHYGFIKNLGWKDVGILNHLTLESKLVKPNENRNISISTSFNGSHAELMDNVTSDFAVSIDKSIEYLDWRYKKNPNVEYTIFNYTEENKLKGFLVTKKYPAAIEGQFNLFIVECGIPFASISLLTEFLMHMVYHYGCELGSINIWLPLHDNRHIYFEKLGFIIGGKPTFLAARANNELSCYIHDLRNWYYTYGDSDIY